MAENKNGNFWLAVFSLVGTTVGAGIFGLPYVFFKAGFFLGLAEFTIIVAMVLLIQEMLGEVVLRTEDRKRFVGLAEKHLNRFWSNLTAVSVLTGSAGILLIYLILGGIFISELTGLSAFYGSAIFFIVLLFAILVKPKIFGRTEFYIGLAVIFLVLASFSGFKYVDFSNFAGFDLKNFVVPYGVIFFAVIGFSVIPKMEDLLAGEKRRLPKAIKYGTLIPAVIYLVFIFAVLGISGRLVSPDAVLGFAKALNSKTVMFCGALLGLLVVSGAALSDGIYLKETLRYDFRLGENSSWLIAGAVPFVLFLLGARNLIHVIGIVGALFFGFQAIVILMIHKKMRRREPGRYLRLPAALYYIIGVLVSLGAVFEIFSGS